MFEFMFEFIFELIFELIYIGFFCRYRFGLPIAAASDLER